MAHRMIFALVLCAMVPAAAAANPTGAVVRQGADFCSILSPRLHSVRGRLDTLKIDHPRSFAWVCERLATLPNRQDPLQVRAKLQILTAQCPTESVDGACMYTIDEFAGSASDIASLQSFADRRACARPQMPDPC